MNWSLVLLVASEFQRYCRSLHDLAVDYTATQTAQLNFPLAPALRRIMTNNRLLDKGNAQPDSLANDFGRLGMQLWPAMNNKDAVRAARCKDLLDVMNTARNGIVHADNAKLADVVQRGYPLSHLETVRKFRRGANQLATLMDVTVAEYLKAVFGGPLPW